MPAVSWAAILALKNWARRASVVRLMVPVEDPVGPMSAAIPASPTKMGLPKAVAWLRRTWAPLYWSPGIGWLAWW